MRVLGAGRVTARQRKGKFWMRKCERTPNVIRLLRQILQVRDELGFKAEYDAVLDVLSQSERVRWVRWSGIVRCVEWMTKWSSRAG
jgi:hypothetical protein